MSGMTIIVKTICNWVKVLILLFGLYIILFGHATPGGGFAGGVILAGTYVLIMLAFGREAVEKNLSPSLAGKLLSVGAASFGLIALAGFLFGRDKFLWNFIYQKWPDFKFLGGGTIDLAEFAIGLVVTMSLYLVIFTISVYCRDFKCRDKQCDIPVKEREQN
ncbi:MAG: MnhB domain-containing protein [Planctomycetes bacterium]|nr:MnhB domain-containing protein [Planctomycetota bacterium]